MVLMEQLKHISLGLGLGLVTTTTTTKKERSNPQIACEGYN